MNKQLSKVKEMMFGLAIGDALGYPTEFMSLTAIKSTYLVKVAIDETTPEHINPATKQV